MNFDPQRLESPCYGSLNGDGTGAMSFSTRSMEMLMTVAEALMMTGGVVALVISLIALVIQIVKLGQKA
ncbi:hypothetical protein [Glacieibacterium sp.]|uniref:hypothetical protein n=1 Tax=Glacieibacterium sp. TaxID=2860237 RepID=UPI003B001563